MERQSWDKASETANADVSEKDIASVAFSRSGSYRESNTLQVTDIQTVERSLRHNRVRNPTTQSRKKPQGRNVDFKAKMHQIRLRLGLRPWPRWVNLQRSPRPSSWICECGIEVDNLSWLSRYCSWIVYLQRVVRKLKLISTSTEAVIERRLTVLSVANYVNHHAALWLTVGLTADTNYTYVHYVLKHSTMNPISVVTPDDSTNFANYSCRHCSQ